MQISETKCTMPEKITKSQLKEASNELQKKQGFYDDDGNYVE